MPDLFGLVGLAAHPTASFSFQPVFRLSLIPPHSAATNVQTGDGVAIKKVTNVFSKKILAKRALREIKLLQHFRGQLLPD